MRDQNIGLAFVLSILTALVLSQACPTRAHAATLPAGDVCDPTARANSWTPAQKARTRARVWAACKRVGGSDLYCGVWQAAVWRESWGGIASAVHTLGVDRYGDQEHGLGPIGLSVASHRGKWPGDDEDPAFCSPEASFIIAHGIAWRAVTVYQARDARGIQAIFGNGRGAYRKIVHGVPAWWHDVPGLAWIAARLPAWTEYRVTPQLRHINAVCGRMGYIDGRQRCAMPITVDDLGRRVPLAERRQWAIDAANAFGA